MLFFQAPPSDISPKKVQAQFSALRGPSFYIGVRLDLISRRHNTRCTHNSPIAYTRSPCMLSSQLNRRWLENGRGSRARCPITRFSTTEVPDASLLKLLMVFG